MSEHRIYLTVNSLEVRFQYNQAESKEETNERLEQLEHFMHFLEELVNSDVPIDLEEFIKMYKKQLKNAIIGGNSDVCLSSLE